MTDGTDPNDGPRSPDQAPLKGMPAAGFNRRVLIVGAGIAGIQTALDIADSGRTVYLVEKQPAHNAHGKQGPA